MRKFIVISLFAVVLLAMSGCYSPVEDAGRETEVTPVVEAGTEGMEPTPAAPEEARATDAEPPVEAAQEALANELGIQAGEIELRESESVEWTDACLQAAEPGEMCATVITPGHRLRFATPDGEVEVRTDMEGEQVRVVDTGAAQSSDQPPAVVEVAVAILVEERGLDPSQIEVVSVEPVEWRDSCLGANQAGEMCLQVITPGYRVILDTPEGRLAVHTDRGAQVARVVPVAETPDRDMEILVWERSGGIAGICQRMTIFETGQYVVEDCGRNTMLARGVLPEADWSDIQALRQEYETFAWENVPPAGAADMFSDRYTLEGMGTDAPAAEQQEALNEQFAQLAGELAGLR